AVEEGHGGGVRIGDAGVGNDADDAELAGPVGAVAEGLAEGILRGIEAAGEGLVHDDDIGRGGGVGGGEVAAAEQGHADGGEEVARDGVFVRVQAARGIGAAGEGDAAGIGGEV